MSSNEGERDFVRALSRGLTVIESFDGLHASMTLSEVAERAKLSRGTARRILITLSRLGYVDINGAQFSLKPRTLRLGYAYLSSQPIWTQARSYLIDVNREIGETCSIAVLDQQEIVFVARVAAKRLVQDYIPVGFRWPAYPTALGRVMLSGLSHKELDEYFALVRLERHTEFTITDERKLRAIIQRAAEVGWSSADREIELGLRSVAAPIRNASGKVIAAINTNAQIHKLDMKGLEEHCLPVILKAAAAITDMVRSQNH